MLDSDKPDFTFISPIPRVNQINHTHQQANLNDSTVNYIEKSRSNLEFQAQNVYSNIIFQSTYLLSGPCMYVNYTLITF